MAEVRKIYGPFGRVHYKDLGQIKWGFIVIKGDHQTCHYLLKHDYVMKKKWWVAPSPRSSKKPAPDRLSTWLDDQSVVTGTITDLLKARLTPDDLALLATLKLKG